MTQEISEFESVKQKLLTETAKINWHELQRFFAQGAVLWVDSSLDLIHVAAQFAQDNAKELESLLSDLRIRQPSNDQARDWYHNDAQLWSVVVAPYVLIQEISESSEKF